MKAKCRNCDWELETENLDELNYQASMHMRETKHTIDIPDGEMYVMNSDFDPFYQG